MGDVFGARGDADGEIYTLFEASGRNVEQTAVLLRRMLAEFPEQAGLAAEILQHEQAGDRIAHDILHRLAEFRGNGTTLASTDVHALAGALDDIVDYAEEAADQLVLYRVEAPMDQAQQLTHVLVAASEQVVGALVQLRAGRDLSANLVEIHRLENEGDRIVRQAIASLFEAGIDPMIVIRWKDIFDSLESAVDACETVAHVLEGMVLRLHHRR